MTLSVRHLHVEIDRRTILRDASVDVAPGEILGIIGPNGAGKSTLLKAMAGLLPAAAGEVRVDGVPLRRLRARARAAQIAMVAQDGAVGGDLTVRELVMLGRYAHRRRLAPATADDTDAVAASLARAGAGPLADRRVAELSGGERQLAQIARALAQGAAHLLLDEPTSALDLHHQLRVFGVLRAQADAGAAVAIVLHDLNEASRRCDRLAVVDREGIRAVGTPTEILTAARLADVWRVEARVHADELGYPHIHPLAVLPTNGEVTARKGTP